ncbi:MAG: hypothetical protein RL747_375 [Bacteroidota bacterium]
MVVVVFLFATCKKDVFKPELGACPTVLSVSPVAGSTGVPLNKVVTVTFNKEMDATSITEVSFYLFGSIVPGVVSYANNVAVFTPSQPLMQNHTYVGHVKNTVKDLFGNHLQKEFVWTFSTGSVVNPMVLFTDPQDLAVDVDVSSTISATFSSPMNAGSIDSSFKLMQGSTRIIGVFSYYDTTAYFIPSVPLMSGTKYTAVISTGATNIDGVPLQSDYHWTFTTKRIDPPVIVGTNPVSGKTGVLLNTKINVEFDMLMNQASFDVASFHLKNGNVLISGIITMLGNEVVFTPSTNLLPLTEYTFFVGATVKNALGISLANDSTWSFTTGLLVAPRVTSTNPINSALNVPLNQSIVAVFDVPMEPLDLNTATFLIKQGSVSLLGAVSTMGNVVTFKPNVMLSEGLQYTATITTGARDLGGTPLANNYSWKFTSISIPKVIAVDPLNLAQSVELNKIVHANFNMPMDAATLNSSNCLLKQGSTVMPCGIGYSGNVLSLAPAAALLPSTDYSVTLTTAVKNVGGIALAADYTWAFKTGVMIAPVVISTSPVNNATNVSLTEIVSATFNEAMSSSTVHDNSFKVMLGSVAIAGSVYYLNNTAYFQPNVNLVSGKTYSAVITTAVKNISGVNIANNYTWTFSTKMPLGPTAPTLNEVGKYGIIAGTAVSNNAGFSKINNLNVGIYPGVRSSITGFPPAVIVNGALHASDDITPIGISALLLQAKTDLTSAYLYAEGATSPAPVTVSGDQGGKTLSPGIYHSTSTLLVQNGDLTLDAKGDVNAVWIFQIASSLTTVGGAGGNIILSGGAQAKNIYWQVGSSATIGGYTAFKGNILALTSITMGVYAVADGRMLARNAAVTMTSTNVINKP